MAIETLIRKAPAGNLDENSRGGKRKRQWTFNGKRSLAA